VSDAIIYNQILSKLVEADQEQSVENGFTEETLKYALSLNPDNWETLIPKLDDTGLPSNCPDGTSGVFCVWDNSYNRCQSTCTWTVPAGVTKAGFQLWGGGGGSSSGCCCGGHPGGSTGEFVSVVMDVTPGDTYILCNSCNQCCLGYRGGIQLGAANSCVSGPGITTLCAQGGCGTLCSMTCSHTTNGLIKFGYSPTEGKYTNFSKGDPYTSGSPVCRLRTPNELFTTSTCGHCFCNGGYDYCAQGYPTGLIPWTLSHCTPSTTDIDVSRNPICGWIGRRWNEFCTDNSHYGYVYYAPTVCFGNSGPTTKKHPGSDLCHSFTSGTCCGSQCSTASAGGLSAPFGCMPGHGAVFSHAMGGNNSICGDTGRGAAIRVTYC